ncbi:hypothetical protein C8R44DRAFT_597978, partial [Mycena epipterygia]
AINIRRSHLSHPQTSTPGHYFTPEECVGAYFQWDTGSLFKTYPFVIHDSPRHDPGYILLSVDFVTSVLRVRSRRCFGSVSAVGSCCRACEDLDASIQVVENWSQQFFGKRSLDRLNHVQLEAKIKALTRQLQSERVKKNNHWLSLKKARKRLKDYEQLFNLVAINEVPGLSRLLSNAKKEGWSTAKTAEKTQLAIDGKYHPRNYTEFDMDLAILTYEL